MSLKYYTHFFMQEQLVTGVASAVANASVCRVNEFRGVIEVNRKMRRGDVREAAIVLARNFECPVHDIKVLQWSMLH